MCKTTLKMELRSANKTCWFMQNEAKPRAAHYRGSTTAGLLPQFKGSTCACCGAVSEAADEGAHGCFKGCRRCPPTMRTLRGRAGPCARQPRRPRNVLHRQLGEGQAGAAGGGVGPPAEHGTCRVVASWCQQDADVRPAKGSSCLVLLNAIPCTASQTEGWDEGCTAGMVQGSVALGREAKEGQPRRWRLETTWCHEGGQGR